jgi:hypothetical protein
VICSARMDALAGTNHHHRLETSRSLLQKIVSSFSAVSSALFTFFLVIESVLISDLLT